MNVEFKPVYERGWRISDDEEPQLYDIFINGEWIGSRRTIRQCKHEVANRAR